MSKNQLSLLFLAVLLLSCKRTDPSSLSSTVSSPVLFSMETKALGEGEHTYRVAFFHSGTNYLAAEGTYCSKLIDHSPTGQWLSPCRVDANGNPLTLEGTEASGLDQADKRSIYGLRLYYDNAPNLKIAAASPAKEFSASGYLRYYSWSPDDPLYVSESVAVSINGLWLDGEYVYASTDRDALELKDRRSRIYVHIECGEISEAYIQQVNILNKVYEARWYMSQGFSYAEGEYDTETVNLFDCGGTPMYLEKPTVSNPDPPVSTWTSPSGVMVPAIDYSNLNYAAMRPSIEVLMGDDPLNPATAVVEIAKPVLPMVDYTFNLYVSKANVVLTLTSAPWDDGGTHTVVTESPAYIGTFAIEGWEDGGTSTATGWNHSFD